MVSVGACFALACNTHCNHSSQGSDLQAYESAQSVYRKLNRACSISWDSSCVSRTMTDLPDVQLDSPSSSRNLGRANWNEVSLDLPSPTSSASPLRLPLRSRSAAALWQNARLSLVASPSRLEQIYSTEAEAEGPGSDPTSRCSSPDGYQRRAAKELRFDLGSLSLESLALERRLAPEREEFSMPAT